MQIDRPIAIALTILIIILLVFFLVIPEYNTFKQLQTELGEKKAEFNAEFAYYAQITNIYFDLQSRPDDTKKIDDALPQEPGIGKLVYFLQKTAKDDGLVVKDLFLSKSSTNSPVANANANARVKDIIFTIELSGDYAALENFIVSLEKSSRLFEITNISFGSASVPPYSFSLQIKTHSY